MTFTEDDEKAIINIIKKHAANKVFKEWKNSLEEPHIRVKTKMDLIPWVALVCAGCFAIGLAIGFRVWG